MSDIAIRVGENIRNLRLARGMSQEKLALRAGMNTSYLGQVERGEKSPTIVSLEKIAHALGIEIKELFEFASSSNFRDTTFIDKISVELKGRTTEEHKDIYHFVRQLLWFKDKK